MLHLTVFVTISSSLLLVGRLEFTLWTRNQLGANAVQRKTSSQFCWILCFLLPHHMLCHELGGVVLQVCSVISQEEVQGCWILILDKRSRNTSGAIAGDMSRQLELWYWILCLVQFKNGMIVSKGSK